MFSNRSIVPVALCLLLTGGCGGPPAVRVSGTLLKGGTPYTPPDGQKVGVTFYAMDSGNESEPYMADFNPKDATFSVPGRDGRGIPPGKYRVAVARSPKAGTLKVEPKKKGKPFEKPDRDKDYLGGQFGPTNSPVVRELTGSRALTIDLDNPVGQ